MKRGSLTLYLRDYDTMYELRSCGSLPDRRISPTEPTITLYHENSAVRFRIRDLVFGTVADGIG